MAGADLGPARAFAEGRRHGEEALRLAMLAGRGLHRSLPTAASASCTSPKGTWSTPSGCWSKAWPSVVPPANGTGCEDPADLGAAAVLRGAWRRGMRCLRRRSGSIRAGTLQDHAGSRGSARSAVWRDAARRPGSTPPGARPSRQRKERGSEALALHQLGVVHAHADPPDVARKPTTSRPGPGRSTRMRPLVAHCHRGLGMLYAAIGQREQARTALSTALDLYRTMDMTFWLPQTEAALAQAEGQ